MVVLRWNVHNESSKFGNSFFGVGEIEMAITLKPYMLEQQIKQQIFALKKLFQVIWTICKLGHNVGQERSKGHETFELYMVA